MQFLWIKESGNLIGNILYEIGIKMKNEIIEGDFPQGANIDFSNNLIKGNIEISWVRGKTIAEKLTEDYNKVCEVIEKRYLAKTDIYRKDNLY